MWNVVMVDCAGGYASGDKLGALVLCMLVSCMVAIIL